MEIAIGFIGALVCLLVLISGCVIGWHLKVMDDRHTQRVTAAELSEKQKRMLAEEQEAWRELYNYNVETAYNLPVNQKLKKE